jgi:hypoxia up-regulated 1
MWNWSTRLFLTDAKQNATLDEAEGLPAKYTTAELEELEETLIAHERWLNQGVEAQKKRQFNEDPAINTKEMKRRAEDLAERLSKLARRKNPTKPKPKKSPTATSSSATPESSAAQATPSASSKPAHEEL